MKDKMTRGVHYEKIMKILLHIGAGIMLSVFIYRSGEAADSHLAEMTEVEKDVLLNRSNNDEVWNMRSASGGNPH